MINFREGVSFLLTNQPASQFSDTGAWKGGESFLPPVNGHRFLLKWTGDGALLSKQNLFHIWARFLNTPTLCRYCLSRQSRCKRYARCFFAWYVCELRQWCIYALVLHTFCTCPRVTFNVRISCMPWSEKPATPPPGSSIRSHTMEQRPQKSRPAKSCIWSTIINDNVN